MLREALVTGHLFVEKQLCVKSDMNRMHLPTCPHKPQCSDYPDCWAYASFNRASLRSRSEHQWFLVGLFSKACVLASSVVGCVFHRLGTPPRIGPCLRMALRLSQSCLTVFSAFWIQDHSDHQWRPGNVSHSAAPSLERSSSSMAVSVLTRGIIDGHLRPHGRFP